jgi:hypothetical protein
MDIKIACKLTDNFVISIDTPNMLIRTHHIECTGEELLDALLMLNLKQQKTIFKKDK